MNRASPRISANESQRGALYAACSATMPPVRLRHRTADHPARGDLVGQVGLVGPGPNRLGKIDIGFRIARHRPRNPRQRLHQVLLVGRGEKPIGGRGELADHQPAAGPGDPGHLAQRLVTFGDVAQPEADGDRVENVVVERQSGGVAGDLRHLAGLSGASMPTEKSAATHHAPEVASSTVDTAVPAARSSTFSPAPMPSANRVARRQ